MGNMVENKVVIITGAGAGIGRDFALAFAANGARVVVNDVGRNAAGVSSAEAVADEIRAAGGQAIAVVESVAEPTGGQHMVEAALDHFGALDGIINNAGIVRDRLFFNMTLDEWRAVIDVHLNGSFYLSRAAATHFKAEKQGAYVHMTSTSGLIGNIGQANYSAAKMALVGLSKSIALDMARYNVRSNCIAPWAWTSMTATIPTDTPENAARVEKLKKMESGKIAPLAIYLMSDQGAHVSGQIFGVRANEIYFFNQIRILRSLHRGDGWTPESIAEQVMPALKSDFFPIAVSADVTPWDPI